MKGNTRSITSREDGFLEVQLNRAKDFDEYLFQQISTDMNCLPCVRDPRFKTKLYYDTKGYIQLSKYLLDHIFEQYELLLFLIYILEFLVKVNVAKPVYFSSEHVYLGNNGTHVKFLVLPLTQDNWVFQKEDSRKFLKQMIHQIHADDAYEIMGYLVEQLKLDEVAFPLLLQGLHKLKLKYKKKSTWIERVFHIEKEETYSFQNLPIPISYPQFESLPMIQDKLYEDVKKVHSMEVREANETVVLFETNKDSYFLDVDTNDRLYLCKPQMTIGRNPDNDIILPLSSISSYHAVFYKENNQLEDLHSSNGTYINQKKTQKAILIDSDMICFANKIFTFHVS